MIPVGTFKDVKIAQHVPSHLFRTVTPQWLRLPLFYKQLREGQSNLPWRCHRYYMLGLGFESVSDSKILAGSQNLCWSLKKNR